MAKTPNFAGFWIRFLAYIIDAVILSFGMRLLLSGACSGDLYSCSAYTNWNTVVTLAYFGGFWMWKAATPGSMLLGMKVVSVDGKPLSVKQVVLRLVGYAVSTLALGIGFIWIGFDAQKQGWSDKIAKTYVVKND